MFGFGKIEGACPVCSMPLSTTKKDVGNCAECPRCGIMLTVIKRGFTCEVPTKGWSKPDGSKKFHYIGEVESAYSDKVRALCGKEIDDFEFLPNFKMITDNSPDACAKCKTLLAKIKAGGTVRNSELDELTGVGRHSNQVDDKASTNRELREVYGSATATQGGWATTGYGSKFHYNTPSSDSNFMQTLCTGDLIGVDEFTKYSAQIPDEHPMTCKNCLKKKRAIS